MQDGDRLLVSGSLPQLGNWQQNQPLMLSEVQTPHWEAEVRLRNLCNWGRVVQQAAMQSVLKGVAPCGRSACRETAFPSLTSMACSEKGATWSWR